MTDSQTPLPPAGWYRDGQDSTVSRWWDGRAWTERTYQLTRRDLRAQLRATAVIGDQPAPAIEPGQFGIVPVAINRQRDELITSADSLLQAAGFTPR